jgi:hypothetical protein
MAFELNSNAPATDFLEHCGSTSTTSAASCQAEDELRRQKAREGLETYLQPASLGRNA